MLTNRHVVVGISGGIAAYKGAELVRLLGKAGATTQVVMTRAAQEFVGKLTLQALSGRPVADELFDLDAESRIGHIRIADEADLVVIAPATAHVIARLAAGLADDLLTTIALATRAPLLLAPAMNMNMWAHPATRANLATLVGRGVATVGPDAGGLACGWVGPGRLIEPAEIVAACARLLAPRDLDGVAVLVTAGPTREPIDPVRYVGNRSSGKMGFAIARRAAARGARVTLVAGPVALDTPPGVERVDVQTAREMRDAVLARAEASRVIVKAAAVADFRPSVIAEQKMKKGDAESLTVVLERNPDILAELGEAKRARGAGPLLVGFAAETGEVGRWAEEKLQKKGCDLLVANDVSKSDAGFGSDENRVTIFAPGAEPEQVELMSKDRVADRVIDRIVKLLGGR